MSQRHIQHHGLKQFLLARTLWENLQTAHHFKSIRYLQDSHSRIGGILDDKLLVVLGFKPGILGLYGGNLVQPVHNRPYILRESADIHLLVNPCSLMKIHSRDTGIRKTDFISHYPRHIVRMADKRRSVISGLIFKRLKSDSTCFFYQIVHTIILHRCKYNKNLYFCGLAHERQTP
ncbi:unknown [Bacteroides sp. CAG:1060]|nr:unknown [Bacteroides sp. CAG:1060]